MLRVAEQYAATDTGRQRRANEDALLSRSPLFVVADGMGGAQRGEWPRQMPGSPSRTVSRTRARPEAGAARLARAANTRIHERSTVTSSRRAWATTLTAMYVGPRRVDRRHWGTAAPYCLRDGELMRLTDDHSLVASSCARDGLPARSRGATRSAR